jgi:hypothetical protein
MAVTKGTASGIDPEARPWFNGPMITHTNPNASATFWFDPANMDADGQVMVHPSSLKPLPAAVEDDKVTLRDGKGNIYLANVIDAHDCYRGGGEPSFVWLQVR